MSENEPYIGYWKVPNMPPKPKPKPKAKGDNKNTPPTADRAIAILTQLAKRMRTDVPNIMKKLEELLFPAVMTNEEKAIARSDRVKAIKELYNRTGCSLSDAKKVVDDYLNPSEIELEPVAQEVELLKKGKKIQAIKNYRERTGCSLKDSKDRIERIK